MRLLARLLPRFPEINNLLSAPVKDEFGKLGRPVLFLDRPRVPSTFDQIPQIEVERQHTALPVFGCSQPHFPALSVNRVPGERYDLASTPAGEVTESSDVIDR